MNEFDRSKTLEELEGKIWEEPSFTSHLVMTCHRLHRKPLKDFTVEDLRIMIGQNFCLRFLVPLAIEVLHENPLVAGDFYEGDLFHSVLSVKASFWKENVELWQTVEIILNGLNSQINWTQKTILSEAKRFRYQTFAALPEAERIVNYDNRFFRSVSNSANGEVSSETIFHYHQKDNLVWATYEGGAIKFGTLVAKVLTSGELEMRYSHVNQTGDMMTGECRSTPEILPDGRIHLREKWQWTSGDFSTGESAIEEVPN